MSQADRAVAYLELNSTQFDDALAAAQKALVAFAAGFSAYKIADFFKEGIDGAIKFGNEAYFAAQKLNGFNPGNLLLVQKSLEAAGASASEARSQIQEFGQANRPLDQLFKGGSSGYTDALQRAAKEYGTQAAVLTKSAEEFSYVEYQLTNIGTKLQGFFLGLADQVARPLSGLLAQIDKLDLVGMGEKFGSYIVQAINTVRGLVSEGKLFDTLSLGLKVGFQTAANYLLGAVNSVINLFTNSSTWSGLAKTLVGVLGIVGSFLTTLFLGLGKLIVATVETGLAQIVTKYPALAGALGVAEGVTGKDLLPSTDVAENLKSIQNNSAIQSLDTVNGQQVSAALAVAQSGIKALAESKPSYSPAPLYDTAKDSKALGAALSAASKAGAALTVPSGKQNPVFTERPDAVHVIADSLARVGGGGRYVRTGLSIAEKAALDSAKYNKISADALTKIAGQKPKNGSTPMGGG
jgi:hypothetical protein